MTNLILCGGSGTRLWPISRKSVPKQFYPLFAGQSLFQETVARNATVCEKLFLAAGAPHLELATTQLAGSFRSDFTALVEPVGRNTAPAIALGCLTLPPDELVLVTPSDHVITRQEAYLGAIAEAVALAQQGLIVTFGLRPTHPETGFGYIQPEGSKVVGFFEKPDAATAQSYVDRGFLWNSGMFVFQAGVFLKELEQHAPEVYQAVVNVADATGTPLPRHWSPSRSQMESLPSVSIDHAVMEKTHRSAVVACDIGWSDLGSFDALYDEFSKDASLNAIESSQTPVLLDAQRNLVVANRTVALVGVEDLLVIDTPDALMIVKRGRSQDVKNVVEQLTRINPRLVE